MDERKKQEVVAVAKEKKKSFADQLKETFIQEDIKEVGKHVTDNVIVPAIKKGFYETITGGLGMLLGIDSKKSSDTVRASQVSYRAFYDKKNDERPLRARTTYSVRDMVFDDKDSAIKVLDSMNDLIYSRKSVCVADFLEMCGHEQDVVYTDYKWGWTDLRGVNVYGSSDGFRINLPKLEPLD